MDLPTWIPWSFGEGGIVKRDTKPQAHEPMDLQWQDEPPSEPGLYWVKQNPGSKPRGCMVMSRNGKLVARVTGYEVAILVGDFAEWAGPIPEPTD